MAAQVLGRRKLSRLLMRGELCILYSKPDKPHHQRSGISWPYWGTNAFADGIDEKNTPGLNERPWWRDSQDDIFNLEEDD